jgi:hypothetical protein
VTLAAAGLLGTASPASAAFGIHELDVTFTDAQGEVQAQAGSHPFAMTTSFKANLEEVEPGKKLPAGYLKDIELFLLPGFIGDQTAVPTCLTLDFLEKANGFNNATACANSTVLGTIRVELSEKGVVDSKSAPVYNLAPSPGSAARLGFNVNGVPVTFSIGVNEEPPHQLVVHTRNISQVLEFVGARVIIWGTPADPAHDPLRGDCLEPNGTSGGSCPAGLNPRPFLTLPRACQGPLRTEYEIDSWQNPGAFLPGGQPDLSDPRWVTGFAETHDDASPPNPKGMIGCGGLGFSPSITAQPTSKAASSPSGLDFSLDVPNEGLKSAKEGATANSDIEKTVVTLPESFSANPSLAEGLTTCSEADLARETAKSEAGAGCPDASKIGTVEVETPLLDENVNGALYIATPYENPFGSLLALYIVIKNEKLGIKVAQPLKVENNPVTGQITTVAEKLPQLPFSHFRLHFREGTRSPLATPPGCGTYDVKAVLTPWSGGADVTTTSVFQIITGPDNSPCPSGGLPPFHPGLVAGSINNAAGRYSPFNVRLFRSDSEQEITHFSIKLPPGIVGKLAGIPFCPDAAIAAAKARTGPHGGREELERPSCPVASQIGRTLAGAGVGPSLAYVPGKVYLAGPYHGSALSIVAITSGVAGPFDLGTVVVRLALKINPETAEVFVDATGSDPIPHIIQGIPVHLRDIRAYADRPEFVLNPTSCARTSTASTVLGSGLDFASEADDRPVTVSTPFQAADCASLGFKPALSLSLKGGTRRGSHPALHAVLRPRAGDANSAAISVQLPHSEFLEQSHIRTVCTRVQFNAGAGNGAGCPAGSIYGHATAYTPLLAQPLEGPVFLRSSEHPLPDLVLALHGLIDFDAVGRVDSVQGGIRNTFDFVPDAPVSKVVVDFEGGKKGLLVNSTDICKGKHRAIAKYTAHNGKIYNTSPKLQAKCPKAKKHKKGKRHGRQAARHRPNAG